MGAAFRPSLKSAWGVMTPGPGTIIINRFTDALYASKCSGLEQAVLLRETAVGVRFPPRVVVERLLVYV